MHARAPIESNRQVVHDLRNNLLAVPILSGLTNVFVTLFAWTFHNDESSYLFFATLVALLYVGITHFVTHE